MIEPPFELLIATTNPGKIRELTNAFEGLPVSFKSLRDYEEIVEVEETGSTFETNAMLKARGYAMQTGCLTLADDSGLEIAALNNSPGVFSARYGGELTGYAEKIQLVLNDLKQTGSEDRSARFVCAMALASPHGEIKHSAVGICEGKIAREPRGSSGFGYDPIFVPDGFDASFGELEDAVKLQISHRARASRIIIRYLLDNIAV